MTRAEIARALSVWAGLTVVLGLGSFLYVRIAPAEPPPEVARAWALEALDRAGRGLVPHAAPAGLEAYRARGLVVVLGWREGRPVFRHLAGPSLVEAVEGAAARVRRAPELVEAPEDTGPLSFTVTVSLGEGPWIRGIPLVSSLGLVPLREGLVARLDGEAAALTPDELLAAGAYDLGVATPVPDLSFGVDVDALLDDLAARLGAEPGVLRARGEVRRFHAFTLGPSEHPRDQEVTEQTLRTAAVEGAEFLLRHQVRSGQFTYIYDGRAGQPLRARGYSLPRHSGTAYFLAQMDHLHGMPEARQGALRALGWLATRKIRRCGAPDALCVADLGRADVGSAALTVVAAAELLEKGPDPLAEALVVGLTRFLRNMQREDGELMHLYDLRAERPEDVQLMYYSGEAAFALLKAHRVLGDPANLEAARRLMGHLTGAGWSFLGSRYYYGEEHWTCIAAGEAREVVDSPEAADFCRRWYEWNDRLQYREGETPWSVAGAYGVGPILVPRLTPVGSRTEAFVGTYELLRHRGEPTGAVRALIERGLGQLLRWRWSPGPAHLFADPEGALGGLPGSPVDLTSRNDFVQHAGSAMIRWADVLRRERAGDGAPR